MSNFECLSPTSNPPEASTRRIAARWRSPSTQATPCSSLILIDSVLLKREEQLKCQALYKKIEAARKKIERHENESVPEFQKWINSTFGKELTEVRELAQKVSSLEDLVEAVYREAYYSGCSQREAYERVTETKDLFEEFKKQSERENREETESEEASSKNTKEDSSEHEETQQFSSKSTPPQETEARIKEIYRQLARRLHPDLNPGASSKTLELWHQVQQAYETHDLEHLETLFALSQMFDNSWNKIEGISTLRSLFKELMASLRQLDKKIRKARKEPAWRFQDKLENPPKLKVLRQAVQNDLLSTHRKLRAHRFELESMIRDWSPSRKKRRASVKLF